MHQINVAVRTQHDVIAPVTHTATCAEQQFHFIELTVAVSIAQAVEAFAVIGVDVQGPVGVEQAATFQQRVLDYFDGLHGWRICFHDEV